MKNLKISRKSLVNSRKFNNRDFKLFRHSELGSESIPCCKLTVLAGKILKPSWIMRHCPKAWFWASYGFRFAHPTANPLQDDCYDNNHNELTTNDLLLSTKAFGFTMAEILLSLTIIGVVAAITLPSLTGNINERTWNTQRKALYSRMVQAIAMMPALNGYGQYETDDSGNIVVDNAAETFITAGLSKVLKINNICNSTNLNDCGIPQKIITVGNAPDINLSNITTLFDYNSRFSADTFTSQLHNTNAAAFETANGESILVYYNPTCLASTRLHSEVGTYNNMVPFMCANFIFDLNGTKGPNTVGKDIGFISALYSSDSSVVMPIPLLSYDGTHRTQENAISICKNIDDESRLPNADEASAMFYNRALIWDGGNTTFWTSSLAYNTTSITAWRQAMDTSSRTPRPRNEASGAVWCVKR